jgi:hypothetical protein
MRGSEISCSSSVLDEKRKLSSWKSQSQQKVDIDEGSKTDEMKIPKMD